MTGWRIIGSRQGGTLTAGATAQVAAGLGQHREVAFFNQPRVGIRVAKTEASSDFPAGRPGAGWEFTLSGCDIEPRSSATTADGSVVFDDLPPAVGCSYTVTETPRDGWAALFASRSASPAGPGQVVTVTFRNSRIEGCESCSEPAANSGPGSPSTPAGSTPASTPTTAPGTTPTAGPSEETTPAPSPGITAVAGERTPGPSPTPLPPSTGFGPPRQGSPLLLLLLGSVVVASGLMFLRMGRAR
jgi:hypothetical protein